MTEKKIPVISRTKERIPKKVHQSKKLDVNVENPLIKPESFKEKKTATKEKEKNPGNKVTVGNEMLKVNETNPSKMLSPTKEHQLTLKSLFVFEDEIKQNQKNDTKTKVNVECKKTKLTTSLTAKKARSSISFDTKNVVGVKELGRTEITDSNVGKGQNNNIVTLPAAKKTHSSISFDTKKVGGKKELGKTEMINSYVDKGQNNNIVTPPAGKSTWVMTFETEKQETAKIFASDKKEDKKSDCNVEEVQSSIKSAAGKKTPVLVSVRKDSAVKESNMTAKLKPTEDHPKPQPKKTIISLSPKNVALTFNAKVDGNIKKNENSNTDQQQKKATIQSAIKKTPVTFSAKADETVMETNQTAKPNLKLELRQEKVVVTPQQPAKKKRAIEICFDKNKEESVIGIKRLETPKRPAETPQNKPSADKKKSFTSLPRQKEETSKELKLKSPNQNPANLNTQLISDNKSRVVSLDKEKPNKLKRNERPKLNDEHLQSKQSTSSAVTVTVNQSTKEIEQVKHFMANEKVKPSLNVEQEWKLIPASYSAITKDCSVSLKKLVLDPKYTGINKSSDNSSVSSTQSHLPPQKPKLTKDKILHNKNLMKRKKKKNKQTPGKTTIDIQNIQVVVKGDTKIIKTTTAENKITEKADNFVKPQSNKTFIQREVKTSIPEQDNTIQTKVANSISQQNSIIRREVKSSISQQNNTIQTKVANSISQQTCIIQSEIKSYIPEQNNTIQTKVTNSIPQQNSIIRREVKSSISRQNNTIQRMVTNSIQPTSNFPAAKSATNSCQSTTVGGKAPSLLTREEGSFAKPKPSSKIPHSSNKSDIHSSLISLNRPVAESVSETAQTSEQTEETRRNMVENDPGADDDACSLFSIFVNPRLVEEINSNMISDDEEDEEPVRRLLERRTNKIVKEPVRGPVEMRTNKTVEEPVRRPVEMRTYKTVEEPVRRPVEMRTNKTMEEPVRRPMEICTNEIMEEPVRRPLKRYETRSPDEEPSNREPACVPFQNNPVQNWLSIYSKDLDKPRESCIKGFCIQHLRTSVERSYDHHCTGMHRVPDIRHLEKLITEDLTLVDKIISEDFSDPNKTFVQYILECCAKNNLRQCVIRVGQAIKLIEDLTISQPLWRLFVSEWFTKVKERQYTMLNKSFNEILSTVFPENPLVARHIEVIQAILQVIADFSLEYPLKVRTLLCVEFLIHNGFTSALYPDSFKLACFDQVNSTSDPKQRKSFGYKALKTLVDTQDIAELRRLYEKSPAVVGEFLQWHPCTKHLFAAVTAPDVSGLRRPEIPPEAKIINPEMLVKKTKINPEGAAQWLLEFNLNRLHMKTIFDAYETANAGMNIYQMLLKWASDQLKQTLAPVTYKFLSLTASEGNWASCYDLYKSIPNFEPSAIMDLDEHSLPASKALLVVRVCLELQELKEAINLFMKFNFTNTTGWTLQSCPEDRQTWQQLCQQLGQNIKDTLEQSKLPTAALYSILLDLTVSQNSFSTPIGLQSGVEDLILMLVRGGLVNLAVDFVMTVHNRGLLHYPNSIFCCETLVCRKLIIGIVQTDRDSRAFVPILKHASDFSSDYDENLKSVNDRLVLATNLEPEEIYAILIYKLSSIKDRLGKACFYIHFKTSENKSSVRKWFTCQDFSLNAAQSRFLKVLEDPHFSEFKGCIIKKDSSTFVIDPIAYAMNSKP